MASRPKLPPFGRKLLSAREGGQHPSRIWVIYGGDCWDRHPADAPVLCIEENYAPGMYDWTILAGVPVHIVHRGGGRIVDLVAEIAHETAPVVVHSSHGQSSAPAFLYTTWNEPRPAMWSLKEERDYLAREAEYYQALLADFKAEERAAHGGRPSAA